MTPHLILSTDDEPQILSFLGPALKAAGYDTCTATTATETLHEVHTRSPDLLALDRGLPDMDGKTVIETLRQTHDLSIIVLSARGQEVEKIMALDLGADDFVANPFAIGELLAYLRVCLRAKRAVPDPLLRLGPLTIDIAAHRMMGEGQDLHLTPKEFGLLVALAETPGLVLTHRQLLTRIWGPAHVDDVPYLRVFIGQLRQKVEAAPAAPTLVVTEPGVGYRGVDEG